MENSLEYYLGKLGGEDNSSMQAKQLRKIVLSDSTDKDILQEFVEYILAQSELMPDTVALINKSILPSYGSEYLGIGKDDFSAKKNIYKQLITKCPNDFTFKFTLAELCLLNGDEVDEIYPLLKAAMLADGSNKLYPSSEMFELIHESSFNFEFDMLLLDKYYQPCDQETFEDWVIEFQEYYTEPEQQLFLENLKWKGEY